MSSNGTREWRTHSDSHTTVPVLLRGIVGYFPLGNQSRLVGSCLDFSLDFFFATYPALAGDLVLVPGKLDVMFAPDLSTLPVFPFRLVAKNECLVERETLFQRKLKSI